uniref:Limb region 1 protein homolog n=1 Tax=Sinocyclocheilus grahami TaxID=75366 RepID=A0A672PJ81_SINGR
MLFLLGLLILGIVWVASALIDNDDASMESLYGMSLNPPPAVVDACIFMGVLSAIPLFLMCVFKTASCLISSVCTPVGLSRMFTVMGQLLVKPTILEDLDEQIYCIQLQEEALERRLNEICALESLLSPSVLERRKKASAWEKNLLYPIVMLILLAGTAISVLLVALNIVYLLVDETALPKGSTRDIGNASLSTFGVAQAVIEIILMFYLLVSSVVGFYSLRIFQELTPIKDDTTMTTIIGCCVSILVLSSALPVMSRTLGKVLLTCMCTLSFISVCLRLKNVVCQRICFVGFFPKIFLLIFGSHSF